MSYISWLVLNNTPSKIMVNDIVPKILLALIPNVSKPMITQLVALTAQLLAKIATDVIRHGHRPCLSDR